MPELLCRVRLWREGHERQGKPDAGHPQATDLIVAARVGCGGHLVVCA